MNLSELSSLSNVINQLKTVINTASRERFPRETVMTLRKRVLQLEDQFVNGVVGLDVDLPSPKEIQKRIAQAKEELAVVSDDRVEKAKVNVSHSPEGAVVVEAPQDTVVEDLDGIKASIGSRLAEEKKKLVAKGKRKSVQ